MAGAHIDTRYIQTDKQQFTTLLSTQSKNQEKNPFTEQEEEKWYLKHLMP